MKRVPMTEYPHEDLLYFVLVESRNEPFERRYRVLFDACKLTREKEIADETRDLAEQYFDVELLVNRRIAAEREAGWRNEEKDDPNAALAFAFEKIDQLPLREKMHISETLGDGGPDTKKWSDCLAAVNEFETRFEMFLYRLRNCCWHISNAEAGRLMEAEEAAAAALAARQSTVSAGRRRKGKGVGS